MNRTTTSSLSVSILASACLAWPATGAAAPLRVVTTLGVLEALTREAGGEHVAVEALADVGQDPHFVQPRPTLMKKAKEADAFVEVGLQLELWAQKVVDGSANPKIQAGQPGRIVASEGIQTLERPTSISREWGDVHPYGNPHVWLDPLNAKLLVANIARGLSRIDPSRAAIFEANAARFETKLDIALFGEELVKRLGSKSLSRLAQQDRLFEYLDHKGFGSHLGGWLGRAAPLRGKKLISFHKTWIYFARRFGFTIAGEIEEKPGIAPSARHRDQLIELIRRESIDAILVDSFYDRTAPDFIAEKSGARVIVVPIDLPASGGDYFALIDTLLDRTVPSESSGHHD